MSADSFARGYSMFVTYLAEPAVRSLAMGCLGAVALWAFRVKRVTTHLLAWTAVLCAALAMPVLGAFLPRVPVPIPASPLVKSLQTSFERGPMRAVRQDVAASTAAVQSVATTMHATVASEPLIDYAAPHKAKFAVAGGALDKALGKRLSKTFAKALRAGLAKPLDSAPRKELSGDANGASVDLPASAAAAPVLIPSGQDSSAADSSALVARHGFAIRWTAVVLGVYLLGVVILLARLLVGVCFSRRLERGAANIEDREALRLLRFRSCIAGLAKAPGLKESAMLAVPATVGVHRAVILLPANWRAWTEEQLDAILAHEISHVARRDALTQMLSLVHRAIFWFSPLSWWLDKQLTDLAEQASDEAALAGGADRARYAETLVGFFKQLGAAPGRVWWQGVSMAKATKPSSAERRVGRILAWKQSMSMKKSFALAVIALAVPVVFLAASVHPFMASAQDKPPVPPQNVMQPGGPVAPVLPKAPKGGVNGGVSAPAIAPGPQGGVVAPLNMTPPAEAAPPALNTPGILTIPSQAATPRVDGFPELTLAQASAIEEELLSTPGVAIRFRNLPNGPITITKATVKIIPVGGEFLVTPPELSLTNNTGKRIARLRVDLNARPMFEDNVRLEAAIGPHSTYQLRPEWRQWSNTVSSVQANELAAKITGVCFADGSAWGECEGIPFLIPFGKLNTDGSEPTAMLAPNQENGSRPPLPALVSGYAPAKFMNPDDAPVLISQALTRTDPPSPNTSEIGVLGPGPTSYLPVVTLTNNSDERIVGIKLRFKAAAEGHAITARKVSIPPHALYTFRENSVMQGRPEDMHVQVLGVKFEDGKVWGSMNAQVDAREMWVNVQASDGAAAFPASTPRAEIGSGALAAIAPVAGYAPVAPPVGYAPLAPPSAESPVAPPQTASSAEGHNVEAQLAAAEDALQRATAQSASDSLSQIRAALAQLNQVQKDADAAGAAQLAAAQHALEKARSMMEQNSAFQMQAANAAMDEAKRDLQAAEAAQEEGGSRSVTMASGNYTLGGGPRYVMMLNDSDCTDTSCNVSMSGSDEDLDHARKLRKNIKGPFIWFERDERSYVITDAAFIAKAKALFAPEDALGKQEDELGRQEDALGKQEDSLGEQEDKVKVTIPDMSSDIDHVRAELDELRKEGATQSELGRLQSELGRLQSQVGGYQSKAGVEQSAIGRQQSDLGRQQAELGRKQAAIGRQQAEVSRKATQQLRGMFDDAIAKGIAKPE